MRDMVKFIVTSQRINTENTEGTENSEISRLFLRVLRTLCVLCGYNIPSLSLFSYPKKGN